MLSCGVTKVVVGKVSLNPRMSMRSHSLSFGGGPSNANSGVRSDDAQNGSTMKIRVALFVLKNREKGTKKNLGYTKDLESYTVRNPYPSLLSQLVNECIFPGSLPKKIIAPTQIKPL